MKKGKVGLENIGNTCYMNAGLQCLFHIKRIIEIVHEDWDDLTGNGVFVEFRKIFLQHCKGDFPVLTPNTFKRTFAAAVHQFSGNEQHDCQEFLSFLLDTIHEELNLGKKVKKIESVSEGMDEYTMAEVFWRNFCRKNSSFVSENFFGQFKSTILCDQGHQSLVFDPFLMVSLPIAKLEIRSFQFIFFKKNLKLPVFKCAFLGTTKSTVRDLAKFVSDVFEVPNDQIKVAIELHEYIFQGFLIEDKVLEANKIYFAYEVTGSWYLILTHRKRKVVDNALSGPAVGYSRVLSLEGSETFEDLHRVVYNSLKKYDKGYLKDFEQVLAGQGSDVPFVYSLMYVNKDIEKVCENCGGFSKNCLVNVNSEKIVGKFKFLDTPVFEILWSKTLGEDDFRSIKLSLNHSSIDHVRKFIDNSKKQKISLSSCMEEFSKSERLENSNRFYCTKCSDLSSGHKKMDFWRLPKILIFHLKRFKQVQGVKTKDNQFVDFPIRELKIMEQHEESIYDLVSVSNHYGDMKCGHYTSYAFNCFDQHWYEFDDDSVSLIDTDQIISSAAYLLFYEKRGN